MPVPVRRGQGDACRSRVWPLLAPLSGMPDAIPRRMSSAPPPARHARQTAHDRTNPPLSRIPATGQCGHTTRRTPPGHTRVRCPSASRPPAFMCSQPRLQLAAARLDLRDRHAPHEHTCGRRRRARGSGSDHATGGGGRRGRRGRRRVPPRALPVRRDARRRSRRHRPHSRRLRAPAPNVTRRMGRQPPHRMGDRAFPDHTATAEPATTRHGFRRFLALVDAAALALLAMAFGNHVGAFSGFPKGYDAWGHIAKIHLILAHWPYIDWNDTWYTGIPHFEGSYPPLYHLLVAALVSITGRSIPDAMNLVTAGCVVVTVVATYAFVHTLTHRRVPALAAGLLVIGTPGFWTAVRAGRALSAPARVRLLAVGAWRTAAWAIHGGGLRLASAALATTLALSSLPDRRAHARGVGCRGRVREHRAPRRHRVTPPRSAPRRSASPRTSSCPTSCSGGRRLLRRRTSRRYR